jgi:beta-ureidopropionase / N-carbamoyl-L-amino-acid hydrolase
MGTAGAPPGGRLSIDRERFRRTFDALASIGRADDGSIHRPGFSGADMEARRWLIDEAHVRGLEARLDGAANVIVRRPGGGSEETPCVLVGSHLDSVPSGGAFDGALGVLIGLEALTAMYEAGVPSERPVEVVAFSDEEGRFGGMFGSKALSGRLTPADIAQAADLDGVLLREAMAEQGLDPDAALHARRPHGSVACYLEVHVEQGPVLDESDERLGLVTDICGLFKWFVTLKGRGDHAGTAPMPMRRDAFGGLAEFATEIPRLLEEHGSDVSVATIGSVALSPGAANSVPAQADFSLDVRDADAGVLSELGDAMRRALSAIARRRGLMFEFDVLGSIEPTPCDREIGEALRRAAERVGVSPRPMPSGAAHDAQMIASVAPIGMLFTPSVGGRSHCAAEWTHWEDVELAALVTLEAVLDVSGAGPSPEEARKP